MHDYQESVTTGQTDRLTDGQTDRQTPDKVISKCRYASQATQKQTLDPFSYPSNLYTGPHLWTNLRSGGGGGGGGGPDPLPMLQMEARAQFYRDKNMWGMLQRDRVSTVKPISTTLE